MERVGVEPTAKQYYVMKILVAEYGSSFRRVRIEKHPCSSSCLSVCVRYNSAKTAERAFVECFIEEFC
jgi:hypothetical protein